MNPEALIQNFIEELHPLDRSICSPGLDRALDIIRDKYIPELLIEQYPTGSDAWTWKLPQKWERVSGEISSQGRSIISTNEEPLCVWSGSLPVDKEVSFEELSAHVYSEAVRPEMLCWYFRYYGNLDWGFNLPHNLLQKLDPNARYHVRIDARYYEDTFRVGTVLVPGEKSETILITSDICHPYQCNDSLSGAAANLLLYRYLSGRKNRYSYRFNFVPETIGTIAYLSRHEDEVPRIIYHLYGEFLGSPGDLRFQESLKGDSALEKIAREQFSDTFEFFPYRVKNIINDELVTSMPNVQLPSIGVNRGMYPEYHTHQDVPARLNYKAICDASEVMRELIDALERSGDIDFSEERGSLGLRARYADREYPENDFIPKPLFSGPIFLSRYGLWIDWRVNRKLNAAIDIMIACLDGNNSVAEIAWHADLPYQDVYDYMLRFEKKSLIERMEKMVCPGTE